jgi:hypothetical protein
MQEVAGDITHSLLHLDSRAWKTLKLLIGKPGELTREFIAGRHQSYLPPFRLYLGISILFFALSALLPDGDLINLDDDFGDVSGPAAPGSPGDASATAAPDATASKRVAELRGDIGNELARAGIDPAVIPENSKGGKSDCNVDLTLPLIGSVKEPLSRACRKIQADGGKRLFEHFATTAPRLMFLFLPLMASVALLFYWRRPRRLYIEHLVLFLHNHAFMFLLLTATAGLGALAAIELPLFGIFGFLEFLLFLYLPYYVYRSMRVVYGDGRWKTASKLLAIGAIYFVLLGVTMLGGFIYTALSLA